MPRAKHEMGSNSPRLIEKFRQKHFQLYSIQVENKKMSRAHDVARRSPIQCNGRAQ